MTNAFLKVLDKYRWKPNKVWEDKRSKFYDKSRKVWLKHNHVKMHSTHNEEKSVGEKCIKALKNKINKYMTTIFKNEQGSQISQLA